jgi:uncharacterized protein
MTDLSRPLDDTELEELARFLDEHAVPRDGMSLEMLDGYLTAIVSGPDMVPPSEWMPYLWQPEGGEYEWESAAQAQRVLDLIMRHMNGIVTLLAMAGDDYSPLLNDYDFDGTSVTFAQEWTLGYLQGVGLREEAWQPLLEDPDYAEDFDAIESLAEGPEDESEETARRTQTERDEQIGAMIGFIVDAHQHWTQARSGPRTPARAAPKPARNDPCPCGSGRKYKVCCGAGATAH